MKKSTKLKTSVLASLFACALLTTIIVPRTGFASDFAKTNRQITYTAAMPSINATGYAERSVAPDTASINLGVVTRANTTSEAKTVNDEVMNRVITALTQLGIARTDMKTSNFSITPNYTSHPDTKISSITSYSVVNTLSIKTHDFTQLSDIIQKAADCGANQMYNVRFYLENQAKIKNELMAAALQNGKKQAALIANSLGLGLGDVLSASVSDYSPSYNTINFKKLSMRGASLTTPIEAGTLKISVTANLAFSIRQ